MDNVDKGVLDDELIPTCGQGVAVGLWHTVCTSSEGDVYAFGLNQFGQLGTSSDQAKSSSSVVLVFKLQISSWETC